MSKNSLTIRDIARMAEVSRSTVSLVLNNSPKVHSATRQKVLDIIEEVGYYPNHIARSLVSRKSRTIVVILPKISHLFTDLYFAETLNGILDALKEKEHDLLIQVADKNYIKRKDYFKVFRERRAEGGIFLGNLNTDYYIKEVADARFPICLVNNSILGVPRVLADNVTGAFNAVEHLVEQGHQRIGFIKGLDEVTVGVDRYLGFKWARDKFRLDKDEKLIAFGNFSEESGYEAMKRLLQLKNRPTAVFSTNDMMAIGAMKAIREEGLKIAQDIALVGGDNNILAHYVQPALTTIDQHMYDLGFRSVELLLDMIHEHRVNEPFEVLLPTRLVVRESSRPKGGAVQ